MAKTILFVSHDASRTGAPLALLHLLEWLRSQTDWRPAVLLGKGGDLQPRFEALAPTFVWDEARRPRRLPQRLADRVRRSIGGSGRSGADRWLRGLARDGVDGVYAASAATARLLPLLRRHVPAPVLLHVRELEYVLTGYVKTEVFRAAQAHVTHYLADSEATRRNLLERHGVAPADVTTIYECIPARRYHAEASGFRPIETRAALDIPSDAYVVAGCGTLQWRKGPDLFLQTGRRLSDRVKRPIVLLWVGGPTRGEEYERFRHEAESLGLADHLRVTGITEEPLPFLAAADVFVLTSREEPLGIAGLEAAVLERPVVCFAGAGGMSELLTGGRGFIVPYADAEAMAEVVERLCSDPVLAAATARRFGEYVLEHHDLDGIAPKIRDAIDGLPAQANFRQRLSRW